MIDRENYWFRTGVSGLKSSVFSVWIVNSVFWNSDRNKKSAKNAAKSILVALNPTFSDSILFVASNLSSKLNTQWKYFPSLITPLYCDPFSNTNTAKSSVNIVFSVFIFIVFSFLVLF